MPSRALFSATFTNSNTSLSRRNFLVEASKKSTLETTRSAETKCEMGICGVQVWIGNFLGGRRISARKSFLILMKYEVTHETVDVHLSMVLRQQPTI